MTLTMPPSSQPADMQLGELADLIYRRQAASTDDASVAAVSPADRIPLLLTPRRLPQPQRLSGSSRCPKPSAFATDAGCTGCLPASCSDAAPAPAMCSSSGALCAPACAAASPGASPQTPRCGGASVFLALPSPRSLLHSLSAVAGGVVGRSNGAQSADRGPAAAAMVPATAAAAGFIDSASSKDSTAQGRRDSGGFSVVRAVVSPIAMLSLFG